MVVEIELTGPRGDNPLGFLTALGALVVLDDAGRKPRLGWRGLRPWLSLEPDASAPSNETGAGNLRAWLLSELDARLRRKPAGEGSVDPSVALGESLTVPNAELLRHTDAALEASSISDRRWVDLVAAFGVGHPAPAADPEEQMDATPWALVSGSGCQHFLGSVAELMVKCRPEHLERALFGPWIATDQLYSLRLDVAEDRRYALLDRDPTAADNKPRTLWGANRLAFEALRLFPAMPDRSGMGIRAWRAQAGNRRDSRAVRWPLWTPLISVGVVGSLLGLPELWREDRKARECLKAYGVYAVYQSRRIAVGEGANVKYNLTPPVVIWRG